MKAADIRSLINTPAERRDWIGVARRFTLRRAARMGEVVCLFFAACGVMVMPGLTVGGDWLWLIAVAVLNGLALILRDHLRDWRLERAAGDAA